MKINKKMQANINAHPYEHFHFFSTEWDIAVADYIAQEKSKIMVSVAPIAKSYGLPKVAPLPFEQQMAEKGFVEVGLIRIYEDYIKKGEFDLNKPIYFVQFGSPKDSSTLMIDGFHRLTYAYRNEVEQLPAILFTFAESKRIRVH